jgi:hypothetical protein
VMRGGLFFFFFFFFSLHLVVLRLCCSCSSSEKRESLRRKMRLSNEMRETLYGCCLKECEREREREYIRGNKKKMVLCAFVSLRKERTAQYTYQARLGC